MVATRKPAGSGIAGASELFQLLRDGQPRTKAELVSITGLARSTVGLRLELLLELGLIEPSGEASSSGGRPPSRFALNPAAGVVIGADLGATHATIAVADLAGNVLETNRVAMPIADGPERVLTWFADSAMAILGSIGRSPSELLAVGMGLPGPIEHRTGRPVNPPIMLGWDNFDVPGWIMDSLGVPALVDNDVNIMAIGEKTTAFADTDNLLFVKVATGIGSGIISGGL
ncbi:MAG: sugar kinase, partial [Microbacteriaceae bacterium]|nr:sugar kinase [Microbacteriaceae bacterium]